MYVITTYIIRSTHGGGYWCNDNGWCSFALATHFTREERDTVELPSPQDECEWLVCTSFITEEEEDA